MLPWRSSRSVRDIDASPQQIVLMVARCMVEIIPRLQGMSREIDQMKIPMIYSIMISFVDVNSGPESFPVKDGFVVSGSGSAEKVVRLWEMISEETKEKVSLAICWKSIYDNLLYVVSFNMGKINWIFSHSWKSDYEALEFCIIEYLYLLSAARAIYSVKIWWGLGLVLGFFMIFDYIKPPKDLFNYRVI